MFQSNSSSSSSTCLLMATIQSYDIPNDVVDVIILLLPAKSLLRFKRVCKHWYNLITDHNFIKIHTNYHSTTDDQTHESLVLLSVPFHIKPGVLRRLHCSSTTSNYMGHDDASKLVEIDCPFDSKYSYEILGSCNGLVCFSLRSSKQFCVWNPCTGDYIMFPKQAPPSYPYPQHTYGFGYDQSMDEYKLVSNEYNGLELDSIQVYTLGTTTTTNSWKNIDVEVPYKFVQSYEKGLFVNEALYWIAWDSQSRCRIIICFDIKTEKYRKVLIPWLPVPNDVFMEIMNLGVLDGCICMTGRDTRTKYCVDVWMMKEEYSWIRYFTITTPIIAFRGLESLKPLRRFCHDDEQNAVLMMVNKKFLVRYEPERDIASYLGWCSDVRWDYDATETTYIESLVSLKSGGIYMMSSRSELKAAAAAKAAAAKAEAAEEDQESQELSSPNWLTSLLSKTL